ncbi:MAG: M14 family zinc carboxypeptidase [Anaerolineae bacterium]|jgi:hypothetical protein|nr:M14 family zinc carboxypeptidase [Anaerolineae bacterium]
MKPQQKKIILYATIFIAFLWVLFFAVFFWQRNRTKEQLSLATPSSIPATSQPSITPSATETPSPTPTPTVIPTATQTPLPTATPILDADGQTPRIIGYSVEGRPLEMYRFGTGEDHRLIIAGIHGGYEYNTVDLAYELITYLQENLELVPQEMTLFLLPALNVDGYTNLRGAYEGRPNANGVDLNRNWNWNWKADWEKSGCWNYAPINGGTSPFSEPETEALRQFILDENINALISYHSAALGIFHGGSPEPHPGSVSLAETAASVSPYAYPAIDYGLCEVTGMLAHWAADQNIAAIDIELTNHAYTDYEINVEILKAFLNWQNPTTP